MATGILQISALVSVCLALAFNSVMMTGEQHVVVVGGGLAGLSAALTALDNGARVTLIDGEKDVGGNSAKASSGMNAVGTSVQKKLGIADSIELFIEDTLKAGDRLNKADLVETLVKESKDAVEWLIERGVPLLDINLLGGQSAARTHWIPSPKTGPPIPVGVKIIRTLKDSLNKTEQEITAKEGHSRLTIRLLTKVDELLFTSKAGELHVRGVRVSSASADVPKEILADAVVLATGGFSNDRDENGLLKEFAPQVMGFPSTNGPFALGTGVKIARKVGAKLIHMDKVQIHPTAFVDPKDPTAYTKFLAAEALRGSGALLLNHEGRRFANELDRRDSLTNAILANCALNPDANARVAYLVMNEAAVAKYGQPAFNFYSKVKGFFTKVENVDELATKINAPVDNIRTAFEEYSNVAFAHGQLKDKFGKKVFPIAPFSPAETLYYALITPGVHYTMGGLEIDPSARVLSEKGAKPIPGLFAAGEVSGGVHGENRLGGNSLLECVVFGRIAGKQAATGPKGDAREEL